MKGTLSGVFCAAAICLVALSMNGAEPSDEKLPAPFPIAPIPNQKLVVGISTGPPFNIRNADCTWTGISVELWQQIAKELKLDFEFRETDLNGNFVGLAQGWLDLAVGPLTITERREEVSRTIHCSAIESGHPALCFRTQGRESFARSDQPHLIAQNA
jgi:ABC-type amino acid transport substrate-binding protein